MCFYPNEKIRLQSGSPLDEQNTTPYPLVCKVGTGHEGRGKIRVFDKGTMKDVRGMLSLGQEYWTFDIVWCTHV